MSIRVGYLNLNCYIKKVETLAIINQALGKSKKSKPKPKRPCFVCGVEPVESALSRHFLTHKDDTRISEALKLPKIEKIKAFNSFKK